MAVPDQMRPDLTEAEMYQAILQSSRAHDHRFFFGVTSTGVFCYPSCSCRKPRRENVRYFATREQALTAGFRPCKRCRPDLDRGPSGYEAALVDQAKVLVQANPAAANIRQLAAALALSPQHLQRIFRRQTGLPLQAYIRQRRVLLAAQWLQTTDQSILSIAGQVGFESLSGFYAAFKAVLGHAPGEFRAGPGRRPPDEAAAVRHPAAGRASKRGED